MDTRNIENIAATLTESCPVHAILAMGGGIIVVKPYLSYYKDSLLVLRLV
jgi:hypothetical protein